MLSIFKIQYSQSPHDVTGPHNVTSGTESYLSLLHRHVTHPNLLYNVDIHTVHDVLYFLDISGVKKRVKLAVSVDSGQFSAFFENSKNPPHPYRLSTVFKVTIRTLCELGVMSLPYL